MVLLDKKSVQVSAASLHVEDVIRSALDSGILGDDHPSALFYDLTLFRSQCKDLVTSFPAWKVNHAGMSKMAWLSETW